MQSSARGVVRHLLAARARAPCSISSSTTAAAAAAVAAAAARRTLVTASASTTAASARAAAAIAGNGVCRSAWAQLALSSRRSLAAQAKKKKDSSGLGGIIAAATAGAFALTTAFGIYTLGAPEPVPPTEPGQPAPPEPDMSPSAWVSRAWKNAHQVYQDKMDPNPEPLLPDILPYPYRASDYTIVLDLEDTLLHTEWTVRAGHVEEQTKAVKQ
ncbi:hypothetical protein PTSG_06058 [Salpingoeca rosetta]|uniref:Mitochondrial import inner membrane translocase subunit TIM50 n=1 Tax=Salpingoeca rosetta (strain ATCC 50818 / BSB-021) TaxID=946362 RepID=F2UDK2_SALR5|nr:uncharacterized protein PTSG_06058 [Salpingoeca rosetta]EGD74697.1 hypothetical protein PTSG_06058 [Salpingoeca rosetta]|eukprot:XP_004992954.1 hypothetical protein PTSG_06058 [Salpingoeca rosetta]